MRYLSKPVIAKVEFQKLFVTDSSLIRIRLSLEGWGKVYINAINHSEWAGTKRKFWGNQTITFLVPKNSIIRVKCKNFFGSSILNYKSPKNTTKLRLEQLPKPEKIEFNELESLPGALIVEKPVILFQDDYVSGFEPKLIDGASASIMAEIEKLPEASIKRNLLKPIFPESLIKF